MIPAISARDLADRLNLRKHPRSWRGRCPACDYRGGVFSVRADSRGRPRLHCANGCAREVLDDAVSRIVGGERPPRTEEPENLAEMRERKMGRARAMWAGSESAAGTLAASYLAARGLPHLADSYALRFRDDTPHPEGGKLPAMVAAVLSVDGATVAVHRTYLARCGTKKADVEPAKASLGPVWGAAIRLAAVAPELVIGEGIESSGAAGVLLGLPAWAAISAGNLERGVVLPDEVRAVVIAADPDPPGERAARAAALRWQAEGRKVRIARPDGRGDFADLLLERRRNG